MLTDIVFFHVILLLRKQCLQIRVMLVLLLVQQTWHFKMAQVEDPDNVIGTVEIQDELETLETD